MKTLADIADDNGTFAFELFFFKNRILQNVSEQIEREFGVFSQDFCVIGRLLPARICI